MERDVDAAARGLLFLDRLDHVGKTGGAVVGPGIGAVGLGLVDLAEGVIPGLDLGLGAGDVGDGDVAAEEVRVGHVDRAFGAVELDVVVAVAGDVPARADGDDGAGLELEDAVDRGRGADLELLAGHRDVRRRDGARLPRHAGERRHPLHRTDELDEVGHVIGPDVEDRTGAGLVEPGRVGMPVLQAAAHHVGGARHDLAEHAAVDDVAHLLVGAAEEGVRRRADVEAALVGLLLQAPCPP